MHGTAKCNDICRRRRVVMFDRDAKLERQIEATSYRTSRPHIAQTLLATRIDYDRPDIY